MVVDCVLMRFPERGWLCLRQRRLDEAQGFKIG